jgi:TonB family protein
VAKFIRLRLRSVQGCYEAQLKRSPTLRGKIVVRFTIGTRGQVVEATIDSDSMGNDAVASCVIRLVRTWRLPFTPESDTPVSFPFLFQPG